MKHSIIFSLVLLIIILLTPSCVTTKVEHYSNYDPDPKNEPIFEKSAVEEYFFISWEPYHFIITLGIIPQYHYVVIKKESGKFEKRSKMIGWLALVLPIATSWEYGDFETKAPID
jgi:hypothetical protein